MFVFFRCGNVAAIFELDENLRKNYTIFEAAPNASSVSLGENTAHVSLNAGYQRRAYKETNSRVFSLVFIC